MKNKIIIHNYTDLEDDDLISYIGVVISKGKISKTKQGEQYSFVTIWESGYIVYCDRKNNTYTFKVVKENVK